MKPRKCPAGHWYDAARYTECPHCRENIAQTLPQEDQNSETVALEDSIGAVENTTGAVFSGDLGPAQNEETVALDTDAQTIEEPKTEPIPVEEDLKEFIPLQLPDEPDSVETAANKYAEAVHSLWKEPEDETAEMQNDVPEGSLQSAVADVRETISMENSKTVAFYDISDSNPVVGWLVCVKGTSIGKSFELTTGRNTIGRSAQMSVPLIQESSVSRSIHAIITYEPVEHRFYIQPGSSSGLVYVNKKILLIPNELSDMDLIQIGSAEFILKVLVGNGFSWEQYI